MVWDTMAFQEETNPGHTAANLHYIASQIQEEKIRENYKKRTSENTNGISSRYEYKYKHK